jgi:hypothetical protein
MPVPVRIAFLHHSTGRIIWTGKTSRVEYKIFKKGDVAKWFDKYNRSHHTDYQIKEIVFPKESPYGWNNYPYDYYNIWVKNEGPHEYKNEPTLELLTKQYGVIIYKHCYPGSNILPDTGIANVDSEEKRVENYKLQYLKLKEKMKSFPDTKFIVWTVAALTRESTTEENARRAKTFKEWVIHEWDEPGDNIFTWDLFELETDGGLYLKPEFAISSANSHPNRFFAAKAAPLFSKKVIDVIEGRGDQL